jgi:hypothetical protein
MYGWTVVLGILLQCTCICTGLFSLASKYRYALSKKNAHLSALIHFFIIEDRFVCLYLSLIHSFVGRNTNFAYYRRQRIGRFLFKLKVI